MTTDCNFSGRSAIAAKMISLVPGAKELVLLGVVVLANVGFTMHASATPTLGMPENLQSVVSGVVHQWLQGIDLVQVDQFDEQIFTEISPLLDSPESVKLPADQQQAE